MDTTGAAIRDTLFAGGRPADPSQPALRIWHSEHVDQYRWVLTYGSLEHEVFHGNAQSFEQAMRDVERCRRIHDERTV